jgi:hypothetical protein
MVASGAPEIVAVPFVPTLSITALVLCPTQPDVESDMSICMFSTYVPDMEQVPVPLSDDETVEDEAEHEVSAAISSTDSETTRMVHSSVG